MSMPSIESKAEAVVRGERLLREVSTTGLAQADLPPPDYVVSPHVPRDVVTLLGSHGGMGKTMLAEIIGAHIVCGRPWAGTDIQRGRVVFVSLEDPASAILYRLRKIVAAYALPMVDVEAGITILDGSDCDAALVSEHNDYGVRRIVPSAALDEIREAAVGASLVVIDNASDAFDGDENNRRQVRAFVRMLAGIARENHAALLLLAHIDKFTARTSSNRESYSGSTAWHNGVRSRLALVEADGRIELRQEKANFSKKADPIALQWSDDGVLMPIGGDPGARLAAAAMTTEADAAALLAVIADANDKGIKVPVGRTGPTTTWHCLSTLQGFPDALCEKSPRRRFWAALDLLQARGQIVRDTYATRTETSGSGGEQTQEPTQMRRFQRLVSAYPMSPIPPA